MVDSAVGLLEDASQGEFLAKGNVRGDEFGFEGGEFIVREGEFGGVEEGGEGEGRGEFPRGEGPFLELYFLLLFMLLKNLFNIPFLASKLSYPFIF